MTQQSWIRHALNQAPWRDQQQTGTLALAVVIIVSVIGAIYLAQASTTAAAGRRMQDMEAERQALEQQNAQLRAEIAALRSVPRLIIEAERMGFRPATTDDVEYIRIEGIAPPPDELKPVLPEPVEEEVPTYEETLESWLSNQLSTFRQNMQQLFSKQSES